MMNHTAVKIEHGNKFLENGLASGIKPEVATLLSPLSFRPKGS